jgi:hypothetical protein
MRRSVVEGPLRVRAVGRLTMRKLLVEAAGVVARGA